MRLRLHPLLHSDKNVACGSTRRDGFSPIQERCLLSSLLGTAAATTAVALSLYIWGSALPPVHPSPRQIPITPATSFIFLVFGFRPPEVVTLASFLWRNDNLRCYHLPPLPEFPPILEFLLPKRSNSLG